MELGFQDVCGSMLLIFVLGLFWHLTHRKFILLLFFFSPPPISAKCFSFEASILRASTGFIRFVYSKVSLTTFAIPSCFPVFKSLLKDEILILIVIALATQHSQVHLQDPLIRQILELISFSNSVPVKINATFCIAASALAIYYC